MNVSTRCGVWIAALAAAAALGGVVGLARADDAAPAGAKSVLNMDSYWRWHTTFRPPTVEPARPGEQPRAIPWRRDNANHRGCDSDVSPAPPDDWFKPAFDDGAWPRSRGRWLAGAAGRKFSTAVLSLRGRFNVTDPAAVRSLHLTLTYAGGVRVFLNGTEVARQHVPDGPLTPETPAELYPAEAFLDAKGQVINQRGGRLSEEDKPRVAKRMRSLGSVSLPREHLRKGVNVLAVEVRRTHYHPVVPKRWWVYPTETRKQPWWMTGRLHSVTLKAVGAGIEASASRPAGVQVWVQDRNDRVYTVDYGDALGTKQSIRLVGARNAGFGGQIVVGSGKPIKGLKVVPSALTMEKGEATIPAANVTLLYGDAPAETYRVGLWFRNLVAQVPAEVPVWRGTAAVLPILVTVRVPKHAAAGEYRGSVAVTAGGKTVQVPVELTVADWTVPDPRAFQTYVGIYQSPTSVAMQYNVDLWSDAHFKKMQKSIDLLGRVGNSMVNIPVADETQFGNPEGMIYWVRKGGGYEYDFTHFDRYLKMIVEKWGPLDYVCLQIWHAAGWQRRPVDTKLTVQVVDEAGNRAPMQVPLWGTPEAVAFWKPFLAAVRTRLTGMGMPKAMIVGILSDSTAPNEVFRTMSAAFPGGRAVWHRGCHRATRAKGPYSVARVGNNVVALHEHCYGMTLIRPEKAEAGLPALHGRRGWPATAYFRVSNHVNNTGWLHARAMAERALWVGKQGIGRICLDFWPVVKGRRGMSDIYNRYPHSSCAQREPSLKSLTWPGPDGAETTMRFEAFVEGLAESEALIVVSEALHTRKAQLGAELAAECERLLMDRLRFLWSRTRQAKGHYHTNHLGWQDLNRRLFDCAAKVSR